MLHEGRSQLCLVHQNLAELGRPLLCLPNSTFISSLCTFAQSISLPWNVFFPVHQILLVLQCWTQVFQKGLPDHLSSQRALPFLTANALTVFAMYFANSFFTVMYFFPIVSFALVLPLQVDCVHNISCF